MNHPQSRQVHEKSEYHHDLIFVMLCFFKKQKISPQFNIEGA